MTGLPELSRFAEWDDRLCEVAADTQAVEDAIGEAESRLASARERNDAAEEGRLLGYLGTASRMLGRHAEAVRLLREALGTSETRCDERARAVALIRLGEAYRCSGSLAEAETHLEEAMRLVREPGLEDLEDYALQHLGKTCLDAGETARARGYLCRALVLREEKGDVGLLASTRRALERAERGGYPPPASDA